MNKIHELKSQTTYSHELDAIYNTKSKNTS